jgi:hypothetical protein
MASALERISHFIVDYYYKPSILATFDTIILGPTHCKYMIQGKA